MRRMIVTLVLFIMTAAPASAADLHILALTQDKTEIEVTVDGSAWRTEELERGLNCRTYKSDDSPTVAIMSYGDVIPLQAIQGKSGDWYCMARIAPPMDGDGGDWRRK